MKLVSVPKAWRKTKNRQLSLSCAWDGHCLPSVSPAKLTASARIEVSMRRVSLRRKKQKHLAGAVMWKDFGGFYKHVYWYDMHLFLYMYFAAKIGWDGWALGAFGPPRDFDSTLGGQQKETTSKITMHMFSNDWFMFVFTQILGEMIQFD